MNKIHNELETQSIRKERQKMKAKELKTVGLSNGNPKNVSDFS